jgi:hypothetical protein
VRARSHIFAFTLGLALALPIGLGAENTAVASEPAVGQQFHGSYKYTGGSKQKAKIDVAIDKATEDMFPGIRGLARSRIREGNKAWPRTEITVAGKFIKIEQVGHRAVTAPSNGIGVPVRSKHGDRAKVTHTVKGGKLIQKLVSDDGGRSNTYKLSEDGKTLQLTVRIWSDRLPQDVVYHLTYTRVS